MQAMHLQITQDMVDSLLASLKHGKPPQIVFGRTPVCLPSCSLSPLLPSPSQADHALQQLKYGDQTHVLHTNPEPHRHELYKPSAAGNGTDLEFAALINHSLVVQKANHVTAGVDSALQQLRSSMAAISEFKEANKYAFSLPSCPSTPCRVLAMTLAHTHTHTNTHID